MSNVVNGNPNRVYRESEQLIATLTKIGNYLEQIKQLLPVSKERFLNEFRPICKDLSEIWANSYLFEQGIKNDIEFILIDKENSKYKNFNLNDAITSMFYYGYRGQTDNPQDMYKKAHTLITLAIKQAESIKNIELQITALATSVVIDIEKGTTKTENILNFKDYVKDVRRVPDATTDLISRARMINLKKFAFYISQIVRNLERHHQFKGFKDKQSRVYLIEAIKNTHFENNKTVYENFKMLAQY